MPYEPERRRAIWPWVVGAVLIVLIIAGYLASKQSNTPTKIRSQGVHERDA